MNTTETIPLGAHIVDSRGTIHWVNGYGSTKVEITGYGDGYVTAQKWDEDSFLVIPLSAILYYRFANEDE